ncbi:hypothetical protein PBY51_013704 [Eleginops maclovinus]|uniref:Uncharacterized protein n=1 Tax=Eleginops maclovinus TaxID=56733 RepID=A0AAN8AX78_ELEMC|nr:hypothetical protein PBY51_013704 [Eleginops maclovinus]
MRSSSWDRERREMGERWGRPGQAKHTDPAVCLKAASVLPLQQEDHHLHQPRAPPHSFLCPTLTPLFTAEV